MNFITYEAAYSLYPRATFEDFAALPFSRGRVNDGKVWEKYSRRGWTMIQDTDTAFSCNNSFSIGRRRFVGDQCSWKLPLSFEIFGQDTLCVGLPGQTWLIRASDDRSGFYVESATTVVSN
jgi:hypothetical protein